MQERVWGSPHYQKDPLLTAPSVMEAEVADSFRASALLTEDAPIQFYHNRDGCPTGPFQVNDIICVTSGNAPDTSSVIV